MMPSDLKVEPVSIACVEASSVTNANIQINANSSLSTYLEYGFTFIVKLSFYFLLETKRWLVLNFTQSTCGYNFKFREGRRCLPPPRLSDSAYNPGGLPVSRKESERNQRNERVDKWISHVGLRPGIGASKFGQDLLFALSVIGKRGKLGFGI